MLRACGEREVDFGFPTLLETSVGHGVITWTLHPRKMTSKKLLVLDVNGLLVDTYFVKESRPEESPDARVGNFYVYKRPFCEEFLQFCLENFIVGIWSSAREHNVTNLVDYVFGSTKERLAFSWHQSDCTDLGLKSPDNQWKPLFLKELSKLWRRVRVDLPWSEGSYGPSNTLLIDDTPYKAILNPPNTAIFPRSYTAQDRGDNFLGGALRSYLEGIRDAASVQTYVESNPFGEPSIAPGSPLWDSVNDVLLKVRSVLNKVGDGVAQIIPVQALGEEGNKEVKPNRWQNGKWKHHSYPFRPVEIVTDEDNKENKRRRWIWKQKPLQVGDKHLQTPEFELPSEAVESQSSELQSSHMLQLQGSGVQVRDSDAYEQAHEIGNMGSQKRVDIPRDWTGGESNSNQLFKEQERPSQVGNNISLRSRQEEPSLDWEHHIAFEPANQAASVQEVVKKTDKEHEENQFIHDENHRPLDNQDSIEERDPDTAIDAEPGSFHEQHCDDANVNAHGEGNGSLEKSRVPVSNDNLASPNSICMQTESNNEENFHGRKKPRYSNFVSVSYTNHASEHCILYSNCRWNKLRGTWEDLSKRNNQRNGNYRGSFSYGQGWMNEGPYCHGGRTHRSSFNEKGHRFPKKQHMYYGDGHNSVRRYSNSLKPPFGKTRQFHQTWGDRPPAVPAWGTSIPDTRSWDHLRQDCRQFSNTGRVRKHNEDWGPSSISWHQGYEQGARARTEQLNVNVHNPDNNLTVQAEARGNGKKQWLDFSGKQAGVLSQPHGVSGQPYQSVGGSSQPYRTAGWPYKRGHGGSREPY